jgi:hypothetical protein
VIGAAEFIEWSEFDHGISFDCWISNLVGIWICASVWCINRNYRN